MAQGGRWPYRDAGRIAVLARWLLYLQALLTALEAAIMIMRVASPAGADLAIGSVEFLAYVATIVVVLRWLYLANANARALGADDLLGSPGWAVGWFLIPILNLVMPFMTVRDMWKASANPKDWQAGSAPAAIGLWWACWLAANFAGGIGLVMVVEAGKDAGPVAAIFDSAAKLFAIPCALLLAWIVGRIQAMQARAWPAAVY